MTKLKWAKPEKRAPRPRKRLARGSAPKRTKRPSKQRKTTLGGLKRKLWDLFARYVKDRDGNTCISCNAVGLEGMNWHAGHMIPSNGNPAVRYDPKNVHSQCGYCNKWLGGNGARYALEVITRYGIQEFQRLHEKAKDKDRQWRAPEVRELIAALERGGADFETLYMEKYGL